MKHVVIIGNGIAGITAAREIRKQSDFKITVISKESKYFFSRTALMYVYMGHMPFENLQPYENDFWLKNRIDLIHDEVVSIDFSAKKLECHNSELNFDDLIFATGSKTAYYNWPGQDLKGVQGLYFKQDLENLEALTPRIKSAVVVGGGLIGVELVEMLLTRGIEVHFVIRDKHFWGSVIPEENARFLEKWMRHHKGLKFYFSSELERIEGKECVEQVVLKDGTQIKCEFVGIATGVQANIDLAKKSSVETNKGILVNEYLETSQANCYAIGDCAEIKNPSNKRKSIEQVWYTGRMMGETVAKTICGIKTSYDPGIWFNSAKFFDIEYQTYGIVSPVACDRCQQFHWEHPTKPIFLTFNFEKLSMEFEGINTFGVRLRHQLFDQWIREKRTIQFVLENLATANFDPEFYRTFENEIVLKFNETFQTSIQVKKKVWWQTLLNN